MNTLHIRGILAGISLFATFSSQAQDERDALRYSFLQPQGTARSIGIGSALGSVGGDFTSLSVNPAGIGIYRRSEITLTPSLTFNGTDGDYAGSPSEASGSHFAFSNLGLVTTKTDFGRRSNAAGWTAFSFGLGLTRLADFTCDYSYGGVNMTSSGSFVFEADANLDNPRYHDQNVSLGDLGYQSFLIDSAGPNRFLSVVNPTTANPISQRKTVKERGGISELGITLGGAYEDKLMIGGTLGFPIVRYTRDRSYAERDVNGASTTEFQNFTYSDELKTTGGGINLKLGFIYKATDAFRFGAAIHTPTYFSLTDVYNQSVTATTRTFGTQSAAMLENQYEYNLLTPWRGVISATAFLGQYGFLTADYEYVDYASARFDFSDKDYQQEVNNAIKTAYQGASNVRTGLEIRLDNFSLRGGFGYYGNPFKSGNPSAERLDFSGGLGFRFQNAFIDLGFVHRQYKSSEQPYSLSGTDNPSSIYYGLIIPKADLTTGVNTAVVTFGFKL